MATQPSSASCSRRFPCAALFSFLGLAPALLAAEPTVTVLVGDKTAVVTAEQANTAKMQVAPIADVEVQAQIPFLRSSKLKLPGSPDIASARLYRASVSKTAGNKVTPSPTACKNLNIDDSRTIVINPSTEECLDGHALAKGKTDAALVAITFAGTSTGTLGPTALIGIPAGLSQTVLGFADSYGFSLNVMDRQEDHEKFEVFEGLAGYLTVLRSKNRRVHVVMQGTTLNFDAERDFELGVGLGVVLHTADENGKVTPALILGYGRNLMGAGDAGGAEYTFVGLGWNISR